MRKGLTVFVSVLLLVALLAGCGAVSSSVAAQAPAQASSAAAPAPSSAAASTGTAATPEKTELKIGTSSVSIDLAESGKKALEDMGYTVEIVVFDDYFLPNTALIEGSLDANFYQHKPFMDEFNASNGSDIIMLEPKLYEYYTGLYSVQADSVETLPDGGIVGIATDASNIDNDLKKLNEAGIITLTDEPQSGALYTILDIVENPHGYEFVQSDHTKYTNMDEYVCLLGTSNTMAAAGVDPRENLIQQYSEADHAQGICIMPENEDTQWVKDIMAAYMADESIANVPAESGFVPAF